MFGNIFNLLSPLVGFPSEPALNMPRPHAETEQLHKFGVAPAFAELKTDPFYLSCNAFSPGDAVITRRNEVLILLKSSNEDHTFLRFDFIPELSGGRFANPALHTVSRYGLPLHEFERVYREIGRSERHPIRPAYERCSEDVVHGVRSLLGSDSIGVQDTMKQHPGSPLWMTADASPLGVRNFAGANRFDAERHREIGIPFPSPQLAHQVEFHFERATDSQFRELDGFMQIRDLERSGYQPYPPRYVTGNGTVYISSLWFGAACELNDQGRADLIAATRIVNTLRTLAPALTQPPVNQRAKVRL